MQLRRQRLTRQGRIGPAETRRQRARIAVAFGTKGSTCTYMERRDQRTKLRWIGDQLPERYLGKCVTTFYPPEAIVVDGDRERDIDVLVPLGEEMRSQGIYVEVMPSSIIPANCVGYYPGRDALRWVLVALMPSRRAHHEWTQRLIEALGSTAPIRSCMYDVDGNMVRNAMAMRLLGFLPPTFKVEAVGNARGKSCDGMMKRADIKRRTDEFYRSVVDGKSRLENLADFAELIYEVRKQWAAEPPPVKRPTKVEVPAPQLTRPPRRQAGLPAGALELLQEEPPLGERSEYALTITRKFLYAGWVEEEIAELIGEYPGLVAYQHTGGTEDSNAKAGRRRLATNCASHRPVVSPEKQLKDRVWEVAKTMPLMPSSYAVLDFLLSLSGFVVDPGDRRIQAKTGLSPRGVTNAKRQLQEFSLMVTTGKARGPGDTVPQAYEITMPKIQESPGVPAGIHLPCTTPPRYQVHEVVSELYGRGVSSGFTWQGQKVVLMVMKGMTPAEIVQHLGEDGLREAWKARSATARRIKQEREQYAAWLLRSHRDDGEAYMAWDRKMTAKVLEAGFCGWRRAA